MCWNVPVLDVPATEYARNGDVCIAYQLFGEGPMLVAIPPGAQNVELTWEEPRFRRMLSAFGSCVGNAAYVTEADLDGSGCVELSDLAQLLSNFGVG